MEQVSLGRSHRHRVRAHVVGAGVGVGEKFCLHLRMDRIVKEVGLLVRILCLSPLELCHYIFAKGVRKHGSEAIF